MSNLYLDGFELNVTIDSQIISYELDKDFISNNIIGMYDLETKTDAKEKLNEEKEKLEKELEKYNKELLDLENKISSEETFLTTKEYYNLVKGTSLYKIYDYSDFVKINLIKNYISTESEKIINESGFSSKEEINAEKEKLEKERDLKRQELEEIQKNLLDDLNNNIDKLNNKANEISEVQNQISKLENYISSLDRLKEIYIELTPQIIKFGNSEDSYFNFPNVDFRSKTSSEIEKINEERKEEIKLVREQATKQFYINGHYNSEISELLFKIERERVVELKEIVENLDKEIKNIEEELTEGQKKSEKEEFEKQAEELNDALSQENSVMLFVDNGLQKELIVDDIEQAIEDIVNDADTPIAKALANQRSLNIGLRKQLYTAMNAIQYLPDYSCEVYAVGIAAVCLNYFNLETLSISTYTGGNVNFELGIKLIGNATPNYIQCCKDIMNCNKTTSDTEEQCNGLAKALGDLFSTDNAIKEFTVGCSGKVFIRPFSGTGNGTLDCNYKIIYIALMAAYKLMEIAGRVPETWKDVLSIPKNRIDGNDYLAAFLAAGIKLALLTSKLKVKDNIRGSSGMGIFIPIGP